MQPRIKICCISSQEEAALAIGAGADALGLVGAMPSGPGVIGDEVIRSVALELPAAVAGFLLTQECTAQAIAEHVHRCAVSTVQVVNHVDPAELGRLRASLPALRIVQVIHVEGADALTLLERYEPHVHTFLLDSGSPSAAVPLLGGTGRVHDWKISAEFVRRARRPVFLAGGLRPDNVREAIRQVQPFGLDICSGVRTDGRLDPGKLHAYVAAIRTPTS
ncbi:MAG TPA: phosphoribosylanthranilate isomerase [Ramlibacter sp.]|jgi:phosphoribosylanthranilate isomerase|uniref:phosphoribosylanthranilate isomerase n=1 Tax=Ramlibacter sp. TaxID=1917967 RepID=UPI002D7236FE|nr:phosphoribosylanthranilate isomerase [Ramlibacter sp.]HZY19527.1 phosphoribosylanthranilate isomerase [Ramlibacter sp.]